MELSNSEIEKIWEAYERERKTTVFKQIKKYLIEKLSALGWPMKEDNIVISWHFNFAVIDFVHKPNDFHSLLSPMEIWEQGGIDRENDRELERCFSKHLVSAM